ncbi:hypothetical protein [Campylobacter gracilis]|uniref:Uncharacterized protein n=1 Tax=Campylobacter gracilis RM3268 TaxID=553220 RepID=C8PKV1_9BACT|nr:hypothetical protein [Campylobacter gracilis]AKT91514.1 hypothetical protein CGRAC_0037 [Campylobacter gracilis]EEV16710.1 hypothetical protein CAMGR0001_0324 [Campylobacter gracilis RM3268]UEB46277.1 hypothetical protein LK410_04070 [Campylobacter gracilis]
MKRKRILKILKFKGGEELNLMCCGSDYETHAANARQIAARPWPIMALHKM